MEHNNRIIVMVEIKDQDFVNKIMLRKKRLQPKILMPISKHIVLKVHRKNKHFFLVFLFFLFCSNVNKCSTILSIF